MMNFDEHKTKSCQFTSNSGKLIDVSNINTSMLNLNDMCLGISRICRYLGQYDINLPNYTVGEHTSIMVSKSLNKPFEYALFALLHDMSEAYLGDMISPIKSILPEFVSLENNVSDAIYKKYFSYSDSDTFLKAMRYTKDLDNDIYKHEEDILKRNIESNSYSIRFLNTSLSYKSLMECIEDMEELKAINDETKNHFFKLVEKEL